ncbi:MAG: glycoside hydrolase family 127 protein, partial [Planctomycetes bacterium]|nr:glycoside hydrolase family 127 protein [Planctomycetota bacterium]
MKRHALAILFAFLGLAASAAVAADAQVTMVDHPATDSSNDHYVGTRPPLLPEPLIKLPIRSIEPRGWVRKQLQLQADGFHGHLGEISRFLNKEGNAWLNPEASGHSGWEEAPYWLKGFANCAYLLRDEPRIAEAKTWIEAALASRQDDGWFGPESNRTRVNGAPDLWPNMIMLFCLQDYYDFTEDPRVIPLMTAYFRYLQTIPDERFLPDYWDNMRGGDLLFSVYWLYSRTGDEQLLKLAEKVHRNTARWDEDVINWHNVNIAQAFREPATWYLQSKRPADLHASYRDWRKVREMYGRVPGGMFGGDENCRPGYDDPRQAIETCGIVEQMLSDEMLMQISGDPFWADHCEEVAFNTYPAAV